MNLYQPTLAAIDWGMVIFVVVAFGGSVGGWILKKAKEASEAREQREVLLRRQMRGDFSGTGESASLDDLAARRRRELQALAQRRGGGSGPASAPPAAPLRSDARTPDNLNMQQASQRSTAKAEYERRAAALRQQQIQVRATQQEAARTAAPPNRAQQAAAQRARAKLAQQQAAELEKRRALAEAQQRAGAARQRARQAPAPARRAPAAAQPSVMSSGLGAGATDVVAASDADIDTGESTVHRHVADAAVARHEVQPASFVFGSARIMLTPNTMRHAILLSEIISPPLALREA